MISTPERGEVEVPILEIVTITWAVRASIWLIVSEETSRSCCNGIIWYTRVAFTGAAVWFPVVGICFWTERSKSEWEVLSPTPLISFNHSKEFVRNTWWLRKWYHHLCWQNLISLSVAKVLQIEMMKDSSQKWNTKSLHWDHCFSCMYNYIKENRDFYNFIQKGYVIRAIEESVFAILK